jgi:hypothetical protein
MTDVTVRWAGPSDATIGSTYKVERTLDNSSWVTVAASQAATAPYVSDGSTLASNAAYGASSVALDDASAFGTSGYAWLDDALIQWSGKTTNTLTGVIWHSGSGIYASSTIVYEAHESYADTGITIANNVVLYRVIHTVSGVSSAPVYIWYYSPPVPDSSAHCVVITNVATDLGVEARSSISVQAYLTSDREFSEASGQHLDAATAASKTATTNSFGLAFHHCWKNSARSSLSEGVAPYAFVLDSTGVVPLTVTVETIPDRDWVLLSQIAS